jgi:hypothetical protein
MQRDDAQSRANIKTFHEQKAVKLWRPLILCVGAERWRITKRSLQARRSRKNRHIW